MNDTKLFYVVDSVESNEELFETYQEARNYMREMEEDGQELVRLRICEVNHAYYDKQFKHYNYDDFADTFTTIKEFNFVEE